MAFIIPNEFELPNEGLHEQLSKAQEILDDLPWVYGSKFQVKKHKRGELPLDYIQPRHLYFEAVSVETPLNGKVVSERVYLCCFCLKSLDVDAVHSIIRRELLGVQPTNAFRSLLWDLIKDKRKDLKRVPFNRKCEIVYQQAGISRALWYEMLCPEKNQTFAKSSVISIAFALKLNLDETNRLLQTVGMILSEDLLEDRVYALCINKKLYDAEFVNSILKEKGVGKSKFLRNA